MSSRDSTSSRRRAESCWSCVSVLPCTRPTARSNVRRRRDGQSGRSEECGAALVSHELDASGTDRRVLHESLLLSEARAPSAAGACRAAPPHPAGRGRPRGRAAGRRPRSPGASLGSRSRPAAARSGRARGAGCGSGSRRGLSLRERLHLLPRHQGELAALARELVGRPAAGCRPALDRVLGASACARARGRRWPSCRGGAAAARPRSTPTRGRRRTSAAPPARLPRARRAMMATYSSVESVT